MKRDLNTTAQKLANVATELAALQAPDSEKRAAVRSALGEDGVKALAKLLRKPRG